MPIDLTARKPFLPLLILAAAGFVLAGCAADGPGKAVAEATGLATTPQESKPFVKETRQANPEYIPVGTVATRAAPRKPVDEFKKLEAELEAKRVANEAAGTEAKSLGATPPPKPAAIPAN
jgi:hypothetical protein